MKGFTLIEVMISLFILLVGMSGVIKLQATSAAITKLSGDLTYAQNLAQTALQSQLSRSVLKVTANPTTTCILDGTAQASLDVDFKGVTYKITCTITKNIAPRLGNKKIGTLESPVAFVDVGVTWTDLLGNSTENNHSLYSYGIIVTK